MHACICHCTAQLRNKCKALLDVMGPWTSLLTCRHLTLLHNIYAGWQSCAPEAGTCLLLMRSVRSSQARIPVAGLTDQLDTDFMIHLFVLYACWNRSCCNSARQKFRSVQGKSFHGGQRYAGAAQSRGTCMPSLAVPLHLLAGVCNQSLRLGLGSYVCG